MMGNIVIAGAGHGGLVAGWHLARAGHTVSVYERGTYETLGHDWDDCMGLRGFDLNGMPRPPKDCYHPFIQMAYKNPRKTVTLVTPFHENPNFCFMDRKALIRWLIDLCKEAGVVFHFGHEVLGPVCGYDRVMGIRVRNGETVSDIPADLVIDAAGHYSPVRRNLPARFGIRNTLEETDVFHCYRAYYNKTAEKFTDPKYTVFFYHCSKPGMDWVITEDGYIDVLIGKFGPLSKQEIDASLAAIREDYPYMGDEILRGGTVASIPLIRTLPRFVANGYAAIGDAAGMTVPLNGCGIDLCFWAGKFLGLAAMGIKDGDFSAERLWIYQYRYCVREGNKLIPIEKLKNLMSNISAENVDFLLEQEILTEQEIAMSDGSFGHVNIRYLFDKMRRLLPQAYLIPRTVRAMRGISHLPTLSRRMPYYYDPARVSRWLAIYNKT